MEVPGVKKIVLWMIALLIGGFSSASISAQTHHAVDSEGHVWWQHAVFFEIYPRGFADSN
jgi:hypothetical protein